MLHRQADRRINLHQSRLGLLAQQHRAGKIASVGVLNSTAKQSLAMTNKLKSGFTLAEVLIVIGIIGTIAAITMPTLMNNIQDSQYKTAWKNIYSELSEATQAMMTDNGGDLSNVCNTVDLSENSLCIKNEYLNYIKKAKDCNIENNPSCSPATYHYLNGTIVPQDNIPGIIMANGAILRLYRFDQYNGGIKIDVNGFRGPNIVGKDYYRIWLRPNGLKPAGYQGDGAEYTSCDNTSYGWGCSAKYLYN